MLFCYSCILEMEKKLCLSIYFMENLEGVIMLVNIDEYRESIDG